MNLSKGWGSRIESVHPYGYIIHFDRLTIEMMKIQKYKELGVFEKNKIEYEFAFMNLYRSIIHILWKQSMTWIM